MHQILRKLRATWAKPPVDTFDDVSARLAKCRLVEYDEAVTLLQNKAAASGR